MRLTSSPSEEHFQPALLAQLALVWGFAIGIIPVIAILVSSASAFPVSTFHTSLSQVAEWIDLTGKPTVIRGVVAEALGFPNADIRVRERGFRNTKERLTHVCSTTDLLGFEDIVFLASLDEATGDALVWRTTRKGELISTAQFADGVAKPMPNGVAQTAFVAEKEYFIREMRTQSFRSNPSPTRTLEGPPRRVKTTGSGSVWVSRCASLSAQA